MGHTAEQRKLQTLLESVLTPAGYRRLLDIEFDFLKAGTSLRLACSWDPRLRGSGKLDVWTTMLEPSLARLVEVANVLQRYACGYRARAVGQAGEPDELALGVTLFIRSFPLWDDLLNVLYRRLPRNENAKPINGWSQLTYEEYESLQRMIVELDPSVARVDGVEYRTIAAWHSVNLLGMLVCPHLVALGVGTEVRQMFSDKGMHIAPEFLDELKRRSNLPPDQRNTNAEAGARKPSDTDEDDPPHIHVPVHGRCGELLVTRPLAWGRLLPLLREHFNETQLPTAPPSEQQWDDLCENAHYIIIYEDRLPIGRTQSAVEYLMRRLVALTRCYRQVDRDMIERHAYCKMGWFNAVIEPTLSSTAHFLAMPSRLPGEGITDIFESMKSKFGSDEGEFQLAGHPFASLADFQQLTDAGLGSIWDMLRAGDQAADVELVMGCDKLGEVMRWLRESPRADKGFRHTLECFETAVSLGGGQGAISAALRESWMLAGLITCLETAFAGGTKDTYRRSGVCDAVQRTLTSLGLDEQEVLQRRAVVHRAYDARNEAVHMGRSNLSAEDLDNLMATVGMMMRVAMDRVSKSALPG